MKSSTFEPGLTFSFSLVDQYCVLHESEIAFRNKKGSPAEDGDKENGTFPPRKKPRKVRKELSLFIKHAQNHYPDFIIIVV